MNGINQQAAPSRPTKPTSGRRRKLGFTIIEVAVAMFALLGGSLMFTALVTMAAKSGKMVGNHQQAVSIVQHKVDQLRAVGYGRLNHEELSEAGIVDPSPTSLPFEFDLVDQLDTFFPNPVGTVQVEEVGPTTRRVIVTLRWSGSSTRQGDGELSVISYISKN
jgi:hypothetical protein